MAITSVSLDENKQAKLNELIEKIPELISSLEDPEYDEIFGYRINKEGLDHVDVNIRDEILLKYLAADKYDVDVALKRLKKTLEWRSKFRPLEAAYREDFDSELETLGLITSFPNAKDGFKTTTWNLYGAIKLPKKLFARYADALGSGEDLGDTPFLRWRIGLMEAALANIDFTSSDNKVAQIHDYENALMFRMDSGMKTATKSIVDIFTSHYPELLSHKMFINVPYILGWVYPALCAMGIILTETASKLTMQSHGDILKWFSAVDLPKKYGGSQDVSVLSLAASLPSDPPAYGKLLLGKSKPQKVKEAKKIETENDIDTEGKTDTVD